MEIIRDNIWLCVDCLFVAVNGDYTGLDYHYSAEESAKRVKEIDAGLEALGPHLVPNYDSEADDDNGIREFSRCGCDCCGSRLAGTFHRFAILGEGSRETEPSPEPQDPPASQRTITRDGKVYTWSTEQKGYVDDEIRTDDMGHGYLPGEGT